MSSAKRRKRPRPGLDGVELGMNKAAAAAELGTGRTTLYARLRRYRITA